MTIELRRNAEDYEKRREAAIEQELQRAAEGRPPPTVSTKAAALFLDVHFDTLGEWRRKSPPLGPPFQKGSGQVGGGANQHVRYLYADLVAWREGRAHTSSKERRLLDELAAMDRRRRELELELALSQAKDEVAKLQKRLGRIAKLETAQDVSFVSHDWVTSQGRVVGHVLAVEDDALSGALERGDVWEATVEEALLAPWDKRESREPYEKAFQAVLLAVEEQQREAKARQMQSDLEARWAPAASSGSTVRPFSTKDD